MARTRQERGFQRLGEVSLGSESGLSAARVRDLRLQTAWLAVAGPTLAARVRAVRTNRGVLELAVDDPRWERELVAMIPRLAARLAAHDAGLGVRRFRILGTDGTRASRSLPEDAGDDDERTAAIRDSGLSGESSASARETRPDIEAIARRYLASR